MRAKTSITAIVNKDSGTSHKSKVKQSYDFLIQMFPYNPYKTQIMIAQSLFKYLSQQQIKVAIVQSPTGTGKTYALLIGVLGWLMKNPYSLSKKVLKDCSNQNGQDSNSIPSWILEKNQQNKLAKALRLKQQRLSKLKSVKQAKQQKAKKFSNIKNVKDQDKDNKIKLEWQIQDIEEFNEQQGPKNMKRKGNQILMIQKLFRDQNQLPKLIFVSRTHSQLSQVMESIQKLGLQLKYANMASKDYLCVHSQLQKTRVNQKCQYLLSNGGCPYYHQQSISDFIGLKIEQAKSLGQQNSLCAYFAVKNILPVCDILCVPYSSILHEQIRDRLGINIQNSIVIFDQAHNVLQQQLNMKSPQITYKQLNLLQNRIGQYINKYGSKMVSQNVNLLRHIQRICNSFIEVIQKQQRIKNKKQKQFDDQEDYFENMFFNAKQSGEKARNAFSNDQDSYTRMTKMEFFIKTKLEEIRLFKIKTYISLSNFDQKLVHFSKQYFPSSILTTFVDFISMLMSIDPDLTSNRKYNQRQNDKNKVDSTIVLIKNLNNDYKLKENKISKKNYITKEQKDFASVNKEIQDASIKIFCMQSTQISKIAEQARFTVFAGGTMEPISSLTSIFNNSKISHTFIKGQHVIKDQQCIVSCIGGFIDTKKPYNKVKISFTFKNIKNEGKSIMDAACHIIKNVIDKTPLQSGTVVFIQSYNLLQILSQSLGYKYKNIPIYYDSATGIDSTQKKQNHTHQTTNQNVFDLFKKTIKQDKNSAILISVMGGKLSQGINFSDQLARSIVVLGLPYPNIKAPQVIQKMKYLDLKNKSVFQQLREEQKIPTFQTANVCLKQEMLSQNYVKKVLAQTGQQYYQNCCIKTINQTIGRGIRHSKDFVNVYLVDSRFAGVSNKLPSWMLKSIKYIDYYPC